MTEAEIKAHAEDVRSIGYTVLPGAVPADIVAAMAQAFWPRYEACLAEIRQQPNRGPMRHYIPLPFEPPLYQSIFHGHPAVIAIVRALLGDDFYCCQYASDTPAKGSVHQAWHRDIGPVFPGVDDSQLPPSLIAANLPLVDVGPDNGPFEVSDGSHHIPGALDKLKAGELPYKPLYMKAGDILVRDPRCIHRGSPNTTDTPRPVLVLGFDRGNHLRYNHFRENSIAADFYDTLSDTEQAVYRYLTRT